MNDTTPPKPVSKDHSAGEYWSTWEIMHRMRLLIVTGSLIAPMIILSRSKMVQDYWEEANPTKHAEKLIASGKVDATYASVLEHTCEDSPNRPDLLRALATVCGSYDPARARACYEQIEKLGATTAEDIAGRALLMAHLDSLADAETLLDGAPAVQATSPAILRAKLAVRLQSGDTVSATHALEDLCKANASDPGLALDVAASCVKEGADAAMISSAEQHAISILSRWNVTGRSAELTPLLQKLFELPLQNTASREAAHRLLTDLHGADSAQSIAAVALSRPASFSNREQTLLRNAYIETSRHRGGFSLGEKDRLADFLQHQGGHSLVLELIPTTESLTDRALFQRRLDSMLHLGMWREASSLAGMPKAPSSYYCQSLFFALSALNKAPAATTRTSDLLITALRDVTTEGRAAACFSIGCAALDMNLQGIATEAFARAVHFAPSDPQILEGIINASRRSGLPVKDLSEVISRGLGSRKPGPLVAQRLCYLHLLNHENPEAVHQFIKEQKTNTPDPVYLRFLEAMETFQQGNFAESFSLLMPLPDYCWHHGETAVIVGIICSAGGADHCAPLAKSINPAKLFSEEKAIVQPWLTRISLLSQTAAPTDPASLRMAER